MPARPTATRSTGRRWLRGSRPPDRHCSDRPEDERGTASVLDPGRRHQQAAGIRRGRRGLCVRAARELHGLGPRHDRRARRRRCALRGDLRVPGAADDRLHCRAVRHPLLPWHHAGRGSPLRGADASRDGGERRRIAQRRGQHLHGSDGGAADHPPLSAGHDPVRADDGHDVGNGPHLGRHHGPPTSCSAIGAEAICSRRSS